MDGVLKSIDVELDGDWISKVVVHIISNGDEINLSTCRCVSCKSERPTSETMSLYLHYLK